MSLLSEIKANQVLARKGSDSFTALVLTTLIGEAEAVGKNAGNRETTDAEVVSLVKKFIKNNDETISLITDQVKITKFQFENNVLSWYLPKQLTEKELVEAVHLIITEEYNNEKNPKLMGKVLASLKTKYNGSYEGSLASKIVKDILSEAV